jgi:coronin-1B/1C/6
MGLKGNSKFFATAWASGGGGTLAVLPLGKSGRLAPSIPLITGHSGPVIDFDFNPFDEYQVLTGSDDTTAKIWQIPEEGVTENISAPLASFEGHQKKVHVALYHKVAANIVTTASYDQTIKIWDVTKCKAVTTVDSVNDMAFSVSYNWQGNQFVSSFKDKGVRIIDARTCQVVQNWEAHKGTKPSRAVWAGRKDKILTIGFGKQSERQLSLWDPRNVEAPLHTIDVDVGAGTLLPLYDEDTNVLFLAGKGDTSIKYFEICDDSPPLFSLASFSSAKPQKGVCVLPKMAGDILKCEIARVLRLYDDVVEVVCMRVPRKSTEFQEDIFPDTAAPTPALSSDQWIAGQNADPILMSCRPGDQVGQPVKKVVKTVFQLQQELDEKDARIAELEKKLAALGGQ